MSAAIGYKLDLEHCAREPIHIPGAIQPFGFLLVVNRASDVVVQAAGDATYLSQFRVPVLGRTLASALGVSLAKLVERADTVLLREPTYLGIIDLFGQRMTVSAHAKKDVAIVELEPAGVAVSAAETLAGIRSITERIGETSSLVDACNFAVAEVARITGYDRVMIYQFFPDGSGSVIAEMKDDDLPPFLNHRYPASDVPQQARELYQRSAIRIIPDVNYTPAPIQPALSPTTGEPLDMSHCVLRSVSAVHIRYLKNMGVGASMSVSILPRGELWGLIACHNTTAKPVSYEAKEICLHVGQILSQQVRAREESDGYRVGRELAAARDSVMRALISADDPNRMLLELGPELMNVVSSHGIGVCWNGTVAMAGHTPTESQIRRLAGWIEQQRLDDDVYATDRLPKHYASALDFAAEATGLLATVLPGDDPVTIMWFRAEQVEEINWAGNPHEPVDPTSTLGGLNPRKSFAVWQESVGGRSRPWEPAEIDSVKGFAPRIGFVLQQRRVRELNRLLGDSNERLATIAATDSLTGLANRRAFDERLKIEWARLSRSSRSLAMIILDVDYFKQYNDHYGHVMGDECLKKIASVLQGGRRTLDLAARIGGEEFAVLLPDTDVDGATALAETLLKRVRALQVEHRESPMAVVTASFGVAVTTSAAGMTSERLLQAADEALYRAKGTGKNRVAATSL